MAHPNTTNQPMTKPCVFCTATIPTSARICRYCSSVLITQPSVIPTPAVVARPAPQRSWLATLLALARRSEL